jgi:hypothetical protein
MTARNPYEDDLGRITLRTRGSALFVGPHPARRHQTTTNHHDYTQSPFLTRKGSVNTFDYLAKLLTKVDVVESCDKLGPKALLVKRKKGLGEVAIAWLRLPIVDEKDVRIAVEDTQPSVDFILNIPKDAVYTGAALTAARQLNVALGGVGDAMRAMNEKFPRSYVFQEVKYVERIFEQQPAIEGFERLDNKRYLLQRRKRAAVTVYVSNAYEVTADEVRTAWEKFGSFDAFVTSNPSALAISSQATSAAETLGSRVLLWSEFMSDLHREWK